jgi:hypothetical protein
MAAPTKKTAETKISKVQPPTKKTAEPAAPLIGNAIKGIAVKQTLKLAPRMFS